MIWFDDLRKMKALRPIIIPQREMLDWWWRSERGAWRWSWLLRMRRKGVCLSLQNLEPHLLEEFEEIGKTKAEKCFHHHQKSINWRKDGETALPAVTLGLPSNQSSTVLYDAESFDPSRHAGNLEMRLNRMRGEAGFSELWILFLTVRTLD